MQVINLQNFNSNYQPMVVNYDQLQNLGVEIGVAMDNGRINVQAGAQPTTRIYPVSPSPGRSNQSVSPSRSPSEKKKKSKSPKKKECDHKSDPKNCTKDGEKIKKCGEKPLEKPGFFKKIGISLGLNKKPLPQCKEYKKCERIDKKTNKKAYKQCIKDVTALRKAKATRRAASKARSQSSNARRSISRSQSPSRSPSRSPARSSSPSRSPSRSQSPDSSQHYNRSPSASRVTYGAP